MREAFPVGYLSAKLPESSQRHYIISEYFGAASSRYLAVPVVEKSPLHTERAFSVQDVTAADTMLLHSNRQIHIRVNRACDMVGSRFIEGDRFGVAWIDREARISEFVGRVGIGYAFAIVARADDVQAASG